MSPTPILDRQVVAPAHPPVKHGRSLAIGCVIGVGLLCITRLDLPSSTGDAPLLLLAGWVGGLFFGILIHELGHVAAGLAVGFEFRRILAGPWMLTRESHAYRLRFIRNRLLSGGYTFMVPRSPEHLRRRFAVFAAGGPLVTALVCLTIALFPWGPLTGAMLVANLVLVCLSWLPFESRGNYSDARIIQILSGRGPAAERLAAVLYLMALDGHGTLPGQWPHEVVANLAVAGDGRAYRAGARILLYLYARDTAPPAEVAAALEQVLAVANELRADLLRMYFAEAAVWQGVVNRNVALARAWLDDAASVKAAVAQKDWDAAALSAIAFAEGNHPQSREYLRRALDYLDRQPGPSGSVAAARNWLETLVDVAP